MSVKNNGLQSIWGNKEPQELLRAFSALKKRKEVAMFLRDVLTKREIEEISMRWKVARMLSEEVPYTKIEQHTGMSSTTIARIHKWLKKGAGGYELLIKRLYAKNRNNTK